MEKMNRKFSMAELDRAIESAEVKSSPDVDGIEYRMIKGLCEGVKEIFLSLINEAFERGYIFGDWKINQTIFIDKGNKKKVRPITMSCMGKIMERMVNERLMWIVETNRWLDKTQNGFRRGRSCTDNITRLTADIEISLQEGKKVAAAFLDVKSAYDNVRKILVKQLIDRQCPTNIIRFIQEWMRDRNTRFVLGNKEIVLRKVNKGLPQGGVISPTLYSIYTAEITCDIGKDSKILQYADDITIYCMDRGNERDTIERLEESVGIINNNLKEIGLEIEPTKTNIIWFNRERFREGQIRCNIVGKEIKSTNKARFLGIVFDKDLKFDKDIDYIRDKTSRIINAFKFVNKVSWGMEVNTALMVYKSFLRSVMEYGIFSY